ncbi:EAL domain-containing response regulator [Colwellia sp. MB02u-6]|uniref:EAL domain-containing response regulator n=1 Tax=Colwellia sp. MB02u-6 TaxID=2759824 RepID=UPI0015F3ACA1|nr:EAL domain-containing response regulator [Colwellia sp. MB02u-6]MBA6327905.1 EAL domain-containing response regulator [Colwellia sp. MB02u-6]
MNVSTENEMTTPMSLPDEIKSLRVLLVDDDEFMLDIIEEVLSQWGIENISRANSGTEALAQVAGAVEQFQLLFCDLQMPEMDGIECLRHVSDLNYEGAVILLSGANARLLDTVGNLLMEHKLNYVGALEKPIDQALLYALLKKLSGAVPKTQIQSPLELLTPDEVREGLETGCVELFFQPKIAVNGQRVLGAECLLRWRHPVQGIISPLAVIPVAEAHGLIDTLTLQIFTKAMGYLGEWTRQGHALRVSVNISVDNLQHLDLPDVLASIVRQAGIETHQVMLEVTESSIIRDLTTSLEIITRLRLLGFGLSIDDFGTGNSSMEKLKQMPFTELKVDRAFVFGAANDPVARAIFESSVKLGHSLGMKVVAEGAETQEDLDLVTTLNCDELQGYVIAKPMPAIEFIKWKKCWENRNINS